MVTSPVIFGIFAAVIAICFDQFRRSLVLRQIFLSKSDYNFFVRGKTIQNSSTQDLVLPQTNCNVQGPGVPASYWRIPICKILVCMKLQLPSSFLGAARFLIAALYKKIELSRVCVVTSHSGGGSRQGCKVLLPIVNVSPVHGNGNNNNDGNGNKERVETPTILYKID